MSNKYLNRFNHVPIGCTGVGLGIGGLGALWTAVLQEANPNYHNNVVLSIIQFFCITITIIFLSLVLLRNVAHKGTFSNEIKHPLLSSFVPTMFMSTMLIAGFIGYIGLLTQNKAADNVLTGIGAIIWYFAVIGHLTVFGLFFYHVVMKHDIKTDSLYASWFVPPVGIIVSCTVASPLSSSDITFIPNELFQAIWYFGFVLYLITLPIISFKLLFHRTNDKNTLPSIMIFGAPANLSLAGFLDVFINAKHSALALGQYSEVFFNVFVYILSFLGVATTLVIYIALPKVLSVKFNPTYACLTFPLAIGATGTYKASRYLYQYTLDSVQNNMYTNVAYWGIRIISYIELAIATIIIAYVLVRYFILIIDKVFLQAHKESQEIFEYKDDQKKIDNKKSTHPKTRVKTIKKTK